MNVVLSFSIQHHKTHYEYIFISHFVCSYWMCVCMWIFAAYCEQKHICDHIYGIYWMVIFNRTRWMLTVRTLCFSSTFRWVSHLFASPLYTSLFSLFFLCILNKVLIGSCTEWRKITLNKDKIINKKKTTVIQTSETK